MSVNADTGMLPASAAAKAAAPAAVSVTDGGAALTHQGCTRWAVCTKPPKHTGACNKWLMPGSKAAARKQRMAELSSGEVAPKQRQMELPAAAQQRADQQVALDVSFMCHLLGPLPSKQMWPIISTACMGTVNRQWQHPHPILHLPT